jgi:hypothetical protein
VSTILVSDRECVVAAHNLDGWGVGCLCLAATSSAHKFSSPRGAIEDKVDIIDPIEQRATNADCRFMRTRIALGSELEGPRLGHENIAIRPLGHAPKAREVQMHPADQ